MSVPAEELVAALSSPVMTLATLPPARDCPVELTRMVEHFDVGDGAAAQASARWLRESALHEHGSARTYAWLGSEQLHGFFAISVGTARLEDEELVRLQAGPRPLPVVLLAQAARNPAGSLPPGAILTGALGVAQRIAQLGGVAALVLDPFDEPTSLMWRRRGFQPTIGKPRGGHQRLWRAL